MLIEEILMRSIYEKYLKNKKKNLIMEKSTQIFAIMKYQKKAVNVHFCQQYLLIQFIEKIKTTILKRYQNNVNMLLN